MSGYDSKTRFVWPALCSITIEANTLREIQSIATARIGGKQQRLIIAPLLGCREDIHQWLHTPAFLRLRTLSYKFSVSLPHWTATTGFIEQKHSMSTAVHICLMHKVITVWYHGNK